MFARSGRSCPLRSNSRCKSYSPHPAPQTPTSSFPYPFQRFLISPVRLYAAKRKGATAKTTKATMETPILPVVPSTKLPPQSAAEIEEEQKNATQLRVRVYGVCIVGGGVWISCSCSLTPPSSLQSVLEARLRDVHEGKLQPGQRAFYQLYRSVVSYPRWLVPGTLHRDRSISTLFTFSRSEHDRGILPIFSCRPEFHKFVELMRTSASSRTKAYEEECFEMPGALLFSQLSLAAHRTNLERVVVDITLAPAFSIAKQKLDTWRDWSETVTCADLASSFPSSLTLALVEDTLRRIALKTTTELSRSEKERALALLLQYRHFLAVQRLPGEALARVQLGETQRYLSLYTALDMVPDRFHDRKQYQIVRAPARQAIMSCAAHKDAGLVLNLGEKDAEGVLKPLAILAFRDGRPDSLVDPDSSSQWLHINE